MKRITTLALMTLVAFGLAACQSEDRLEKIEEQQGAILEKLTAIEQSLSGTRAAARPQRPQEDYSKVYAISYDGTQIKGNPDAPVTLVEWSDFECPYCAGVSAPIQALLKKYPQELRVAYKHFPLSFHRAARPTAIASQAAAEQGCFWSFHDVLFEATSKRQLDASKIDDYAKQAGCDVAKFKSDLDANRDNYGKRVDADYKEGTAADVRGTPALYINGRKVRDRSVAGMSTMIDEAVKSAGGE
jgi:protein-disulfide isomerase